MLARALHPYLHSPGAPSPAQIVALAICSNVRPFPLKYLLDRYVVLIASAHIHSFSTPPGGGPVWPQRVRGPVKAAGFPAPRSGRRAFTGRGAVAFLSAEEKGSLASPSTSTPWRGPAVTKNAVNSGKILAPRKGLGRCFTGALLGSASCRLRCRSTHSLVLQRVFRPTRRASRCETRYQRATAGPKRLRVR